MDPTAVLTTVVTNFVKLLPFQFLTIHCYEQGVKFRAGSPVYRCFSDSGMRFWYPLLTRARCGVYYPRLIRGQRTGIHFFWNWIESIKVWPTAEMVMETNYQTVTLRDTKELTVSLTVAYKVIDVEKIHVNVNDFVFSLENLCQGSITEVMARYDRKEFMAGIASIKEEIRNVVNEKVEKWGVHVHALEFVNTPAAKNVRLFSNGSMIG